MKDLFSTAILGLVTVALLVAAWSLGENKPTFVPLAKQQVPVDLRGIANKVIDSRVVGSGANATVEYAYVGERVQDKLDPEEVEWMRTENSWTRNRTTQKDFDRDEYRLEAIIYPQKTFVKKVDGWHNIEHGVAPKKEFDQAMGPNRFFALFARIAYADTLPLFSGAGDGYITAGGLGITWSAAHDAVDGVSVDPTSPTFNLASSVTTGKFGGGSIYRAFIPFDTSSISVKAVITAATLNVFAASTSDTSGDSVTVVQTTQATHTTLAVADFDQVGTTQGTNSPVSVGTMSTSAYTTIPLNSTGLTWIKKSGQSSVCTATTGITCLGLRTTTDINNSAPANDTGTSVSFYSSEMTSTQYDPYLSVTFTAPQSVLEGGIWMGGGGGKLNVVGGKVNIL